MKNKLRATVTLIQEYEADSKNYGNCDFVEDMIEMDKQNFDNDPLMFIEEMLGHGTSNILIKDITEYAKPQDNKI